MTNWINFTQDILEKLKSTGSREVYRDKKNAGLALRIGVSGEKTWYLIARVGGKTRWENLGTFQPAPKDKRTTPAVEMSLKQAIAEAQNYKTKVGLLGNAAQDAALVKSKVTLDDLWKEAVKENVFEWEEKTLADKKSTWKHIETIKTRRAGNRPLAEVYVREITQPMIEELKRAMMKDSRRGADKALQLVRQLITYGAGAGGHLPKTFVNPVKGVARVQNKAECRRLARRQRITLAQAGAFLRAIDQYAKYDDKRAQAQDNADAITVLLWTMLRKQNVLRLRWSEVDFEARTIGKPASTTKTDDEYTVPMNEIVYEVLRRRHSTRQSEEWVFPSRRSALKSPLTDLRHAWPHICGLAKIPAGRDDGIIIHDLRRTIAKHLRDQGTDINDLSGLLKHRLLETTRESYVNDDESTVERHRDLLNRAADAFLALKDATKPGGLRVIDGGQEETFEVTLTASEMDEIAEALGTSPLAAKFKPALVAGGRG